ncbi:MAG: hydroxyacid dehydrogenase [Candidatus Omnitrophica bacterium]|nr:hydroxyacid dehydrogenase [Candidatus Omnitrophota bacterium]
MRILVTEAIDPVGVKLLEQHFDVSVILTQDPQEVRRLMADADAIVVKSRTPLTAEVLAAAPHLKAIGRVGNGLDNIDLEAARVRQIAVFHTPDGATQAVAELTLLQMLALCRRAYEVHRGWLANDYRRSQFVGCELRSRTVGIVGFGRIGEAVACLLQPFGCARYAWDTDPTALQRAAAQGVRPTAGLEELMAVCNIVTLHVPLTTSTRGMLDARRLRLLPQGAFLLNLARGGLIDEAALLEAIRRGRVAAAAIDVLAEEPSYDAAPEHQTYTNPLLSEPAILLTPHLGASTLEAQQQMSRAVAEQLIGYLTVRGSKLSPVQR